MPSIGLTGNQTNKVSVKLQNGSLPQPWTTQSEIIKYISLDQWQEITFDFERAFEKISFTILCYVHIFKVSFSQETEIIDILKNG